MGIEIERKFLVINDHWKTQIERSVIFRQGYLTKLEKQNDQFLGSSSVRVRIEGEQANINIKSLSLSISRMEYEYPIPLQDANEMLDKLCPQSIAKTRHYVMVGKHTWEIDVFTGANQGLVVAEIELSSEDEAFDKPDWLGLEVSQHSRYYNVCLLDYPYSEWTETECAGL